MSVLRRPIERRLSTLVGTEVSIGSLDVSLLQRSLDARDVVIGSINGEDEPIATIRRVKAEVAPAMALRKQLSISSAVIERPEVRVEQDVNGRLQMHRAPRVSNLEPATAGNGADDDDDHAWRVDLRRVLLVDGAFRFASQWAPLEGLEVEARGITAELVREPDAFRLILIADSVAAAGGTADLGELNATFWFTGVDEVSELARASVSASLGFSQGLRVALSEASLLDGAVTIEVTGSMSLPILLAIIFGALRRPMGTRAWDGHAQARVLARFTREHGLVIRELELQAADVRLT